MEHWSFLAFQQRLEAAARGLPAVTTGLARRLARWRTTPATRRSTRRSARSACVEAHAPDVALVHGAVADRAGNVAFHPPLLEGVWGALAARRGAIVTVEQVVDDIRPWAHLVRLPAHRVLSVSECPMGAHPGGLYGRFTPAEPYGEDVDFWAEVREASRRDDFDDWIRERVLDVEDHDGWIGEARRRRGWPGSGSGPTRARGGTTRRPTRPTSSAPPNAWETAAAFGARVLADRIVALGADTALAGAGVANLATWLGVRDGPRRRVGLRAVRRARACGGTSRRRPTRSCSTTGPSRPRRCWPTRPRSSAW